MINAWALAAEVLEGTLDETYPIKENPSRKSSKVDERCEDNSDSQQ